VNFLSLRRSALAACALGLLACTTVTRLPELVRPPSPSPAPTHAPSAIPRTAPSATPPAGPSDEEIGELQDQVVGLRGLHPAGPLSETLLDQEGLLRQIREDFLADYTRQEAVDDARVLALFDLLDRDFDLWSLYNDLYAEQTAGYYDPSTGRMYIVAPGGWTGVERLTYVHEFTHALQDQTYDLEDGLGYSDEACEDSGEHCQALSALIEGDASLLEEQWLRTYSTEKDYEDLLAFFDSLQTPVYDGAPAFMKKDFLFPYEQGLEFVRNVYLRDGWAGVDEVYRRLPESTEQILHPSVYPRATPVPVEINDLASALGAGWEELNRGVLGEWYTRLMLETRLPESEAAEAAAGWGGDAYLVVRNESADAEALVLVGVWDGARDAHEFITAMIRHAEARFGETTGASDGVTWTWDGGRVLLLRAYTQTLFIVAPDAETAEALRLSVDFPVAG
jgi:hypothetical protein